MPSTPRCHEMPQGSIQVCFDTNWKPASPVSNDAISQIDIAAVATAEINAISLGISGREDGVSATSAAPTIGTSTIAVRIGNAADAAPASAANITGSPESPRTIRATTPRRCR